MDEQLTDIRELFPDDEVSQHIMLQNTFPVRFHARSAKNMPREDSIDSTLGLDLLTVIIRHLYCFLKPGCLVPDGAEGEEERRLIRWTWSNLSEDAAKQHPSHAIRYSILKSYYPHGLLGGRGLSFLALAEHDLTYKLSWRPHLFLLYAPLQVRRDTDASDWHMTPLRHPDDVRVLERDSLVRWDAQLNLSDLISSKFGLARYGQAQ